MCSGRAACWGGEKASCGARFAQLGRLADALPVTEEAVTI